MADDRPRKLQRPACRRCVHAAGIEGFVNCWTTHDRNVCLRHQLWIGQGCPQPDDQVDISILPSTSRAHRHHRNLISRLGRRWVSNAFPDARNIFLSWITGHSADPFGDQATARSRLVGEAGRPADSQTADGILFHPQIVSLTGLLASPIWEAKTVQSGDISWLVREITYRDILVGYVKRRQLHLMRTRDGSRIVVGNGSPSRR